MSKIAAAVVGAALCVVIGLALSSTASPQTSTTLLTTQATYPSGIADSTQPSGEGPLGADSIPGYTLSYVYDFTGSRLPAGWDVFVGSPGGDPKAYLARSHVVVSGGVLRLQTSKDPARKGEWVAGGLCQCGFSQTYGAYFVRSRLTGAGPNEVQLLWPLNNTWPPEIDFNESGQVDNRSAATVHWGADNEIDQRSVDINMTHWHTWGVIWTPASITFTVDGQVWGDISIPYEIPDLPMTLHIQQQTWCGSGRDCPTAPVSMLVNWVAEYAPDPGTTTTTMPAKT